jgi:hypothetical protein
MGKNNLVQGKILLCSIIGILQDLYFKQLISQNLKNLLLITLEKNTALMARCLCRKKYEVLKRLKMEIKRFLPFFLSVIAIFFWSDIVTRKGSIKTLENMKLQIS